MMVSMMVKRRSNTSLFPLDKLPPPRFLLSLVFSLSNFKFKSNFNFAGILSSGGSALTKTATKTIATIKTMASGGGGSGGDGSEDGSGDGSGGSGGDNREKQKHEEMLIVAAVPGKLTNGIQICNLLSSYSIKPYLEFGRFKTVPCSELHAVLCSCATALSHLTCTTSREPKGVKRPKGGGEGGGEGKSHSHTRIVNDGGGRAMVRLLSSTLTGKWLAFIQGFHLVLNLY